MTTFNHHDAVLDSEIALNAASYLQAFVNEKKEDKKKIENLTKENEKLINKIEEDFNSLFVEKQKIEQFEEKIGNLTEENEKLKNKIKSLNTENIQVSHDKLIKDINSLFAEKQQIEQLEEKIEYLTDENEKLKNNINSLNTDKTQVYYNKIKEDFNSLFAGKQQTKQLEEKIENLTEENEKLKNNADELQSSYDKLKEDFKQLEKKIEDKENTIKELNDEDKNNPVQLKDDISRLQKALDTYVTNLRPNVNIDLQKVTNLLEKYNSKTKLSSKFISNITLFKAVLQRHVLENIFGYFTLYTNHNHTDHPLSLEAQIERKANELIQLTKNFAKMREGNDEVTPAVPVKIRQQIYSALGNRGFSYINNNNQQIYEHNFINQFKTELNEEMGQYRKILNAKKKDEIEEKAANIIIDVIRILLLRIRTQEPIIQIRFFKYGDKIDPDLMEDYYLDDEDFDDFEVDICRFPLIGAELDDNSKRKIYSKAIVHLRKKQTSTPVSP